jgi:hypothetical protein
MMKSIKSFLINLGLSALLIFIIYCYLYEFDKTTDIQIGMLSLSSFIASYFMLQQTINKYITINRNCNTKVNASLLKSVFFNPLYIILLLSPICIFINDINIQRFYFIIVSILQIVFTTLLIICVLQNITDKCTIPFLSALPTVQWMIMILADKTDLTYIMIFNPFGSFFYGLLGPAFENIWTITCYFFVVILSGILFIYLRRINKSREETNL